jgi:hypothetical protein
MKHIGHIAVRQSSRTAPDLQVRHLRDVDVPRRRGRLPHYVLISLALCTAATAQIAEPRIGFAWSADGSILDIRGLSGSFIVSRTGARADAAAWSGRLAASLVDDTLTITNAAGDVLTTLDHASGAIFGFSADGESAVVFRPVPNDLSVWRAGSWSTVPLSDGAVNGAIESIALDNRSAVVAITRDADAAIARIRLSDGAIEDERTLDGAASPVLVLPGGRIVFASGQAVIIEDSRGSRLRADVPGTPARLAQLGTDWAHVMTSDGALYALRLSSAPVVYAIPDPQE